MRRVLLVDDHAGFRRSVRRILEAEGFDVIGEAADGRAAIEAARELRPDVVLLDVQLPDLDGFAVADELTSDAAGLAVILTSSRDAPDYGGRIEASSARGFVPKGELSCAAIDSLL